MIFYTRFPFIACKGNHTFLWMQPGQLRQANRLPLFLFICYQLFPFKSVSAATEDMVSRGRSLEEGNHNSPQCCSRWLFPPLNRLQWRHDTLFEVLPRLVAHSYIAMNWSVIRFMGSRGPHEITLPHTNHCSNWVQMAQRSEQQVQQLLFPLLE